MKKLSFLLLLSFPILAYSQLMTEDELKTMVETAVQKSAGAHTSVIQRTNEEFAKSIWGKKVRFNDANIIRFMRHSSGEKVSAGVSINSGSSGNWSYSYDQNTASDLLTKNGVRVTKSYNTLWINANQDLLYADNNKVENKIVLELYCPQQRFLEVLRTGQTQSIEFLITGYRASTTSTSKIYGVLTEVYTEKQVVTCENGHEFDKAAGYKFCPTCGEALK